jgi:Phage Mu protein F like protein
VFEFKRLPPKEAIAYFRQKGYAIGFSWEDVWQQEHQAAFTVAKAMQLDILRDIREAVDSALSDGTTFATFRQNLKPLLVQKGWWGKADMTDPLTGELRKVQLGSTRRLKTIFDTNLRTAHSEGQWERIQRSKDTFPYLIYDANNSEHPRIQHSQWDNLVLPVDDPFWLAHKPVKAWGCKCGVRQANAKMLEQRGLKVGESPSTPEYTYTNRRTGEIQKIPLGVDPAFNYPPGGRSANLPKFIAEKIIHAPADIGSKWQSVTGISNIYDPYRAMVRDILDADERRAAGAVRVAHVLPPDTVRDMADRGHVLESAAVMLRDRDLVHAIRPAKNDRGQILPESVWLNLPDYLGGADIYLDTQDTALVYAFDVAEDKGKVVVRVNYSEKIRDAEGNRSRVVGNFISTGGVVLKHNMENERYILLKK